MDLRKYVATTVAASTLIGLASGPAQAFTFKTNYTGTPPVNDINLDSVEFDGQTISDFALVNRAEILYNTPRNSRNLESSGAASAERGDAASGINVEDPTNADIVASLNNRNLNNIIDGEDAGKFTINLFFEQAVNTLFFWERGMNSDLGIQAIDALGNVIGDFKLLARTEFKSAGFSINTTEINSAQRVGSLGVTLADLGLSGGTIAGVRVSAERGYNGPDFKVVGTNTAVPEPTTLAGLGLVAGSFFMTRRRKAKQAS